MLGASDPAWRDSYASGVLTETTMSDEAPVQPRVISIPWYVWLVLAGLIAAGAYYRWTRPDVVLHVDNLSVAPVFVLIDGQQVRQVPRACRRREEQPPN
jgi:hypothetical protein